MFESPPPGGLFLLNKIVLFLFSFTTNTKNMTATIIIAIVGIVFIFAVRNHLRLKKQGFQKPMIRDRRYIMGHPDIDKSAQMIIAFKNKQLHLLSLNTYLPVGIIRNEQIKTVNVEDQTTMERRVTLGRLALFGLFAFAMQKNKKQELLYLVIDWHDGRDNHSTVFEYAGRESRDKANSDRNTILRMIKEE